MSLHIEKHYRKIEKNIHDNRKFTIIQLKDVYLSGGYDDNC